MNFLKALPSRTERINWLILILSLGTCLLLAGIMGLIKSDRNADPLVRRSSTFFADDNGMLAAYLVAERLLPSVQRLQRPYLALGGGPQRFSSIVLAGPQQDLTPSSADALDSWISQGGQLILACDKDWPIGRGSKSLSEQLRQAARQASRREDPEEETPPVPGSRQGRSPEAPQRRSGYLERHGISLLRFPQPSSDSSSAQPGLQLDSWIEPQGLEPLLQFEGHTLAAALRLGKGRLVVVPDRLAFSNQRLGESSNAVWLIQTIAGWDDGWVAFDEYHQGFGVRRSYVSLLASFAATPWGWACLQLCLAGLAYLLIYQRRFGRLQQAPPTDRRSPMQLVQARGQLLAAAEARPLAVEWIHRALNLRISRSLGYPVDLDSEPSRERLGSGASPSARLLREYWESYQELSSGRPLSDQDLIQLGRSAGRLAREFQAGSARTI